MEVKRILRFLTENKACEEAVGWVSTYSGDTPFQQVWDDCRRADWMLWYLWECCGGERILEFEVEGLGMKLVPADYCVDSGDCMASEAVYAASTGQGGYCTEDLDEGDLDNLEELAQELRKLVPEPWVPLSEV